MAVLRIRICLRGELLDPDPGGKRKQKIKPDPEVKTGLKSESKDLKNVKHVVVL